MAIADLSPPIRRALALSILFILVAGFCQWLVAPLVLRWQEGWDRVAAAAEWQHRLEAAAARAQEIEAALKARGRVAGTLQATGEALAAAELQSLAQAVAAGAGAQVLSLEPLSAKKNGDVLTVRTRLRANLDEPNLPDFLAAFAKHDPVLSIAQISIGTSAQAAEDGIVPLLLQAEIEAVAVEAAR